MDACRRGATLVTRAGPTRISPKAGGGKETARQQPANSVTDCRARRSIIDESNSLPSQLEKFQRDDEGNACVLRSRVTFAPLPYVRLGSAQSSLCPLSLSFPTNCLYPNHSRSPGHVPSPSGKLASNAQSW